MPKLDREKKLEIIKRSLGLRHKLKVHESMRLPDTHEELAVMLLAKWELEDELAAIEGTISDFRSENVATKKSDIQGGKPLGSKKSSKK